jgi:hypothetical protein
VLGTIRKRFLGKAFSNSVKAIEARSVANTPGRVCGGVLIAL